MIAQFDPREQHVYRRRYLEGDAVRLDELPPLAPSPCVPWTHRQWFREHPRYTLDRRTESCLVDMPRTWRLIWWRLRYCAWRNLVHGLMNRLPYWLIRVPKPMAVIVSGKREVHG